MKTMGLSLSHHSVVSSQRGAPFLICAPRQVSHNQAPTGTGQDSPYMSIRGNGAKFQIKLG